MRVSTKNRILIFVTVIASAIVTCETAFWPFSGMEFLPMPAFIALVVSLFWIGLFAVANIDWEGKR